MESIVGPSILGLLLIASTHLFVNRLTSIKRYERVILDSSAGIAVAYAFVDVFPHLAKAQARLPAFFDTGPYAYLAHHAYLVALLGFVVYLGVRTSLDESRDPGIDPAEEPITIQLATMVAFMLFYNFIVGYMLAEQPTHRYEPALVFAMAMTAHFIGMNHEHRSNHPFLYDERFRYVYIAALVAGYVAGILLEMSDATFGLWFAFLAGGIVSTGLATELPRIQTTRSFVTFCGGAMVFTAAILIVEAFRI